MTEYKWTRVSVPITMTKPATFHRWVWFWQVGWYKPRGWQVSDRTFLKVKIWREMRLEDYIYYGDEDRPVGLASLDLTAKGGGIERKSERFWRVTN